MPVAPRIVTEAETAEIKRVISYDAETGRLFHRVDRGRGGRCKAGTEILTTPNKKHGYLLINVLNRHHLAHRVAWLLGHGEWPTEYVDHIDHCKTNNRLANLRAVSHGENMKNASLSKSNTTGVAGVHPTGRKRDRFRATANVDGRQTYLGDFKDFERAVAVRKEAEARLGYHQNHGMTSPGAAQNV